MTHHHEDGLGPPVTSGLGGAVILTWSHHLETSMKHVFTSKIKLSRLSLIDEQITKIYSQVIQACFILMESSVTVIGIDKALNKSICQKGKIGC